MGKKFNALRKQVKDLERQLRAFKEEVAALRPPAKSRKKAGKEGEGNTGKKVRAKAPARKEVAKPAKARKAKIANSTAAAPLPAEVPAAAGDE